MIKDVCSQAGRRATPGAAQRIAAILPLFAWALPAAAEGWNARDVLDSMEAAAARIDMFQCRFQVTEQMRGTTVRDSDGHQRFVFADEDGWFDLSAETWNLRASGPRFWRAGEVRQRGRTHAVQRCWDGVQGIEYDPHSASAVVYASERYQDGKLQDPRAFVYQDNPLRSRVARLRQLLDTGGVSISETVLDGRPVLLVEGLTEATDVPDYKIWIDRERGFLPLQIETYSRRRLVYRYTQISHLEVVPGTWFPIGGTLEQIEYRDPSALGRIRSTSRMDVEPASVSIGPEFTAPETYRLDLPPGTRVKDLVRETEYLVAEGGSVEDVARLAARQARQAGTPSSSDPPSRGDLSKATRSRHGVEATSGRERLAQFVICGLVMLALGFGASWLFTRLRTK